VQQVVQQEWGTGLIGSWNSAGWMELAPRIGDKIARLIGAGPGECVAADSTSVNLFKVLSAALNIARADAPARRRIVSERSNFPTDLYIAEALAQERGLQLVLADAAEDLPGLIDERCAVLMLTHVNYSTGRMHDMAALTRTAHEAGALALWDLAHSAGAVAVDLRGSDADFAVGCGYKYLNGGPGAPAFVWAAPRHAERFWQPLAGWIGHAAPFEFSPGYRPAPGIRRYLCGTPPVLSLAALECGVDTVLAAEPFGGMGALRRKSLALTQAFAARVEARCAGQGLALVSPRDSASRGSQVCFSHPTIGYAVIQALIARGVVGDFRAPDILRFGFTPLYTRFVDVWHAVEHLHQVLEGAEWREARFNQRAAVT
jgi:kynureninase